MHTWIVTRHSDLQVDCRQPYLILAYYHLFPLENPEDEVRAHHAYFAGRDVKGRIYLARDGINGTLSAPKDEAIAYMQWLWSQEAFQNAEIKVNEYHDHAFGRLSVKTKPELVALGEEVNLNERGPHLQPAEWRKMYEEEEDKVVLDVRNDYEWKLGRFEGAEVPPCETFKDFKAYANELKTRLTPNTKVLMYCTGGIRCEFFSAVLKSEGIEEVYQLQGGVIKYGAEEKSKHWQGKLFVFDDRLSVPISDENAPVVGHCHHCQKEAESYYNCANMDCNELFICCEECLKLYKGCCDEACKCGARVRPYKLASTPFRRWYTYAKTKEELNSLRAT